MIETLREIASKLWSIGLKASGALAIFEFFRWILSGLLGLLTDWVNGKIDYVWGLIEGQLSVLSVDLTPGSQFASYISKLNVVLPLDEAWRYLLLYLSIFSVVVGVKWMRNLIPGIK